MTKKEFFTEKTALKLKYLGKVAELKESYSRDLSELTDEQDRINLTMAHRAKLAKAEEEYLRRLLDARQRDLAEAAEQEAKEEAKQAAEQEAKEAAEREAKEEAKEAAEREAKTVWPDGSWWSAAVTARRVISKVHPRHGESLSLSFHYQKGEGWWIAFYHIGGGEPHNLFLSKAYPVESMEEETRTFAAAVNGDNGEPLAAHFSPSATGLAAFDNALNAAFGERKGGDQ